MFITRKQNQTEDEKKDTGESGQVAWVSWRFGWNHQNGEDAVVAQISQPQFLDSGNRFLCREGSLGSYNESINPKNAPRNSRQLINIKFVSYL